MKNLSNAESLIRFCYVFLEENVLVSAGDKAVRGSVGGAWLGGLGWTWPLLRCALRPVAASEWVKCRVEGDGGSGLMSFGALARVCFLQLS